MTDFSNMSSYDPSWDAHTQSQEEFASILKELASKQPSEVFIVERNTIKRAGVVAKIWQTIKGWLGFENMAVPTKVTYELLKLLRYGESHRFFEQDTIAQLARQLKATLSTTPEYSPISSALDAILSKQDSTQAISRQITEYYSSHEKELHEPFWTKLFRRHTAPLQQESAILKYNLGVIYAKEGKLKEACQELSDALAVQPLRYEWQEELKKTKHLFIEKLISQGKLQEAYSLLEKAYEASPDDSSLLQKLCDISMQQENWHQAQEWVGRLIAAQPNSWQAHFDAATIASKLEKFHAAVDFARRAVDFAPPGKHEELQQLLDSLRMRLAGVDPRVMAELAQGHLSKNEYAQALEKFQNVRKSHGFEQSFQKELYTCLIELSKQQEARDPERAMELVRESLHFAPHEAQGAQRERLFHLGERVIANHLHRKEAAAASKAFYLLKADFPDALLDAKKHSSLSTIASSLNLPHEAIGHAQKALKLAPLDPHLLVRMYELTGKIELGTLSDTIQAYTVLARSKPNDWQISRELARLYLSQNDLQNASHYLENAHKLNPRDQQIVQELADCYKRTGNVQGLERLLPALHAPHASSDLAMIHFKNEEYDAALKHFEKARESKELKNSFTHEVYVCLINIAKKAQPEHAFELLLKAETLASANERHEVLEMLLPIAQNLVEHHKPDVYQRLMGAGISQHLDWKGHQILSTMASTLGLKQDAIDHAERALALAPHNPELIVRVYELTGNIRKESLGSAIAAYKVLAERKPRDGAVHKQLAGLFREDNNLAECRATLEKALVLLPDDLEVVFSLADFAYEEKSYAKALDYYERAESLSHKKGQFSRKIFECQKAEAKKLMEQKSYQKAAVLLEKAKQKAPDDEAILRDLADCYRATGNTKALADILPLLKEPSAYADLAQLHFKENKFRDALSYFQKARMAKEYEHSFKNEVATCLIAIAGQEMPEKALDRLREAAQLVDRSRIIDPIRNAGVALIELRVAEKNFAAAVHAYQGLQKEFSFISWRIDPAVYVGIAQDPKQRKHFSDAELLKGLSQGIDGYERDKKYDDLINCYRLSLDIAPQEKRKALATSLLQFIDSVRGKDQRTAAAGYGVLLPQLHKMGLSNSELLQIVQKAGEAQEALGLLEKAIATYKLGLQYEPKNLSLHEKLGRIYDKQGEKKQAIHHYEEVFTLDPSKPLIKNRLCALHIEMGDAAYAIAAVGFLHQQLKELVASTNTTPDIKNALGAFWGARSADNIALQAQAQTQYSSFSEIEKACRIALGLIRKAYDGQSNHMQPSEMPFVLKIKMEVLEKRVDDTDKLLDGIVVDKTMLEQNVSVEDVRDAALAHYKRADVLNERGLLPYFSRKEDLELQKTNHKHIILTIEDYSLPRQEEGLAWLLKDEIHPKAIEGQGDPLFKEASSHGYFRLANYYLNAASATTNSHEKQQFINKAFDYFKDATKYDKYDKADGKVAEPDCYGRFGELYELALDDKKLSLPGLQWETDQARLLSLIGGAALQYQRAVGANQQSKYSDKSKEFSERESKLFGH